MKTRRCLLPLMAGLLLSLPAAAHAVAFGPDLTSASPNNPYTCGNAGGWSGCAIQDPTYLDMESVLPDPISHGNQTGVITDMHVLSAGTAHARLWSLSGRASQDWVNPSRPASWLSATS